MNQIKQIRDLKKLSLEKVAQACEPPTTAKQIQRLETGERRLTTDWINKLSKALDCEPADIVPEFSAGLDDKEQKLLELYRRVNKETQNAFIEMLKAAPKTE